MWRIWNTAPIYSSRIHLMPIMHNWILKCSTQPPTPFPTFYLSFFLPHPSFSFYLLNYTLLSFSPSPSPLPPSVISAPRPFPSLPPPSLCSTPSPSFPHLSFPTGWGTSSRLQGAQVFRPRQRFDGPLSLSLLLYQPGASIFYTLHSWATD